MGFFRQEYWSGVPLPSPKLMVNRGEMLSGIDQEFEVVMVGKTDVVTVHQMDPLFCGN